MLPALLAQAASSYLSSDFWQRVTVGVIVAIFSATLGYFISERNRKYQTLSISYNIGGESLLEFNKEDIESRTGRQFRISYDSSTHVAEDLYLLSCDLENIGKRVIKYEHINFEIMLGQSELLSVYFDPPVTRKFGFEEIELIENNGKIIKRYLIKNISSRQKVGFRFVIARPNRKEELPALFVGNPKDSKVELVPGGKELEISNAKDTITRFIILSLIFVFIPPFFYLLPSPFNEFAVSISRLVILLYLIPIARPFARIVSEVISKLSVGDYSETAQTGKYIVNIGTGSALTVGDIYKDNESSNIESDVSVESN